jgi:hypothetical protein
LNTLPSPAEESAAASPPATIDRARRRAEEVAGRGARRRAEGRLRPRTPLHRLLYAVSLPERLVRSIAGWLGAAGLAAARLVPRPVRESRFYRFVVERQLKLLCDDLGGAGRFPGAPAMDAKTAVRLGVGGALDNAAILTLHWSPLWLLLAAKDAADGAKALVGDVLAELRAEGLVEPGSRLDKTEELLAAVAKLSERAGDALDCPPLRVEDLRATLEGVTARLTDVGMTAVVDVAQLDRLVDSVRRAADASRRPLFDVLTGVAVAAADKGGKLAFGAGTAAVASVRSVSHFLYDGVVLDYQRLADDILTRGLFRVLAENLAPHVRATVRWFSFDRLTFVEKALTRGRFAHEPWARRRGSRG